MGVMRQRFAAASLRHGQELTDARPAWVTCGEGGGSGSYMPKSRRGATEGETGMRSERSVWRFSLGNPIHLELLRDSLC